MHRDDPNGSTVPDRPRVLLTGFGPFPGVKQNVSGDLARRLAARARARFPRYCFVVEVLPVSWERAPAMLGKLTDVHRPLLSLHFGVSERANGLTIETCARNAAGPHTDCDNALRVACVLDPEGPAQRHVPIPAFKAARHLARRGIPVSLSDDAGAYLCNAILYRALTPSASPIRRRGPPVAGFIHVPIDLAANDPASGRSDGACRRLTFDEAIEGSLEILRLSLAALARRVNRS